jgi:erythritol transport system ATP-binding protein
VNESAVILEARAITKRYPGTIALDSVDFRVYRNEVNVLIGENGAGKSTLMRVLAGVETPDEGSVWLDGTRVTIRSPRDAARYGISIVHQELSVLPNLDLAENIFAGREPRRAGVFVHRAIEDHRSVEALGRLRKPMDVRTLAGDLSLGCRQIVEVARALDQEAKILILDEPTSALSNTEAESLFAVIGDLKRAGVSIVYISHRLNELLHVGDRFTVLRSGRVVGEAPRSGVSRQWIVERMSGRDALEEFVADRRGGDSCCLLRAEGLTVAGASGSGENHASIQDVSFTIQKGEILGIYGLLGAGRTELLESLAGLRTVASGRVTLDGRSIGLNSVTEAVKNGIHLVPEDRQRDGLVPDLSIRENIALTSANGAFLHRAHEVVRTRQLAKELNIGATDLELPVTVLSGGNQQKVLIARCLMRSPRLLLLDEPTRGVDVGAKAEIYTLLRRLAMQGIGVIFTSSEIEETQALADRALVLCQGRISAEFPRTELTDQRLFEAASPRISAAPGLHSGVV